MATLKDQTFIIVGGAGYIGSHVCKMIAEQGGTPITFDNFSSGYRHAVRYGPAVQVDLRDRPAILSAVQAHADAKAVIHLASSIEVAFGEKDPEGFYENNVLGAFNLLSAMQAAKLGRLIFSSTCAVYGEASEMPLREDQVPQPVSVYGKTKLAIEHMIESYHNAYGLDYVIFRYFNAAGADPSGEIGEEHDPETHLIPIAIEAARTGKQMKVFGDDYNTRDGTCIRDYIHVNDIARAHCQALEKFDQGSTALALNIGTGHGQSILEVLKALEAELGQPLNYDITERRKGDVSQLYADPSMARKAIGFEPLYSSLDHIIATAWNFHKQQAQ